MKAPKLRLGPLPNSDVVKISVTISVALRDDLERYARAHALAWGQQTDVLALIPFMLENFIARDRVFKSSSAAAIDANSDAAPRRIKTIAGLCLL